MACGSFGAPPVGRHGHDSHPFFRRLERQRHGLTVGRWQLRDLISEIGDGARPRGGQIRRGHDAGARLVCMRARCRVETDREGRSDHPCKVRTPSCHRAPSKV
jgi:hypothetical protein